MSIWGSIIGTGLQMWGANKAAKSEQSAADTYSKSVTEAAKPKSVYDPMSQAVYDDATESYRLGLSPELQRLFQAYTGDIVRQRALAEPMVRDPEAAALQRYNADLATLKLGEESATNRGLSKLRATGMLGSSIGAGALAELDRQNLMGRADLLSKSRTGVQSDITNLLNRELASRQAMISLGAIPQSAANIGRGVGSTLGNAAVAGGKSLMDASANVGATYGNLAYGLGSNIGSGRLFGNTPNVYQQAYQSGWNSPQGYQAGYTPQAYQAGYNAYKGG
jgi:hypothetical protein